MPEVAGAMDGGDASRGDAGKMETGELEASDREGESKGPGGEDEEATLRRHLWIRYINLATRLDRRTRIEQLLLRADLTHVASRFEAVLPTDPRVRKIVDELDGGGPSAREWACAFSHFGVWAAAAAQPPETLCLVLEDDVVMLGGWMRELARLVAVALPSDWELLFLDCTPLATGWQFGGAGAVRSDAGPPLAVPVRLEGPCSGCSFADAYLLTPAAARHLLTLREEEPYANAETLLVALQDRGHAYTTLPRLALQLWCCSDIQTDARTRAFGAFYRDTYHRHFPRDLYEYDMGINTSPE